MNHSVKISATLLLLVTVGTALPAIAQIDRPSFFRDGQQLMEQEIQRMQRQQEQQQSSPQETLEHPSELLTINERSLNWQKFIFRDGGFSVWMPEGVRSEETVVLDTIAGKLPFEVFTSNLPSWRFVAAYSEDLKLSKLADSQAILVSVRDGIVQETKFKLTGDRDISWNNYSGKELTMQDGTETIAFRVYLIGKKVYVLAAGQKNAAGLSEDAVSFFDSLRMLK